MLDKLLEEFDKLYLNPDLTSSASQFNPKYAGRLYQEFQAFIKKAYKRGATDMGEVMVIGELKECEDNDTCHAEMMCDACFENEELLKRIELRDKFIKKL